MSHPEFTSVKIRFFFILALNTFLLGVLFQHKSLDRLQILGELENVYSIFLNF
jgi:hypothetical protein